MVLRIHSHAQLPRHVFVKFDDDDEREGVHKKLQYSAAPVVVRS